MLPSAVLYFALFALLAGLLLWRSFRVDRILGWAIVLALTANVTGAAAMGWWVHRMHGREYTAGDEIGYQWEGARLLHAWRTGRHFVRATVGAFAPINAVVIEVAGPGQTQMRVTTAVVGAAGVAAVYSLAMALFGDVLTARIAALLAATSPLLILYSWANLRDRWIGVAAVLALLAFSKLLTRWSWASLAATFLTLLALGSLRHYWAMLIGWLCIPVYVGLSASPWRRRLIEAGLLIVAVGAVLWLVTGSFLAYANRSENATRYVSVSPAMKKGVHPATPRTGRPHTLAKPGSPGNAVSEEPDIDEDEANAGPPPFSGETLGKAVPASRPASVEAALRNLGFVLFGRVHARPDGGQYAARLLLPEALWSFLLVPLAILGAFRAGRLHSRAALLPALYVCGIVAILTWLRGDDWNTYRFRDLYWSVLLIFAAAGISWLVVLGRSKRRGSSART